MAEAGTLRHGCRLCPVPCRSLKVELLVLSLWNIGATMQNISFENFFNFINKLKEA
jgi:hypothetical protein